MVPNFGQLKWEKAYEFKFFYDLTTMADSYILQTQFITLISTFKTLFGMKKKMFSSSPFYSDSLSNYLTSLKNYFEVLLKKFSPNFIYT